MYRPEIPLPIEHKFRYWFSEPSEVIEKHPYQRIDHVMGMLYVRLIRLASLSHRDHSNNFEQHNACSSKTILTCVRFDHEAIQDHWPINSVRSRLTRLCWDWRTGCCLCRTRNRHGLRWRSDCRTCCAYSKQHRKYQRWYYRKWIDGKK